MRSATGTLVCGTVTGGSSPSFKANGILFSTSSTINISAGSNVTVSTDTQGYVISATAGGGSGGGVGTSSPYTSRFIPVVTSTGVLTNSNIMQTSTGEIGIGTTDPHKTLQVGNAATFGGS